MTASEGIFVSAKAGALVSRMASVPSGRPVWIGCRREDGKLVWDEEAVVFIPADEYRGHRRTYDRHLRLGELVERTPADFAAYEKGIADKARAEAEKVAADKAKAEAEAKKAAAAEPEAGAAKKKGKE